jgi:BirA family biotin operon repressor/biotin-[acetyl-CoA-carboxylase] ligase
LSVSPLNWRVQHFEVVDSTNDWLRARALDGEAEGLVAIADYQSAGRGRLDRTWESPAGSSLLCSILLRPAVTNDDLQLVVAAVALSARAALARLCALETVLKWPNDLLVGHRKLAGLLAELVWHDGDVAVVVGIGVNLTFDGPPAVQSTSVLEASGMTITARSLLEELLVELVERRERLDSAAGRRALRDEYMGCLATIGRRVRVERGDGVVVGIARGVDETGRLIVDFLGDTMVFAAGDVVHVRGEDDSDDDGGA